MWQSLRVAGRLWGGSGGVLPRLRAASSPSRAALFHSSSLRAAAPSSVRVSVNGVEVEVPSGFTVMQACESAGEHVPRFCYHDRLSIAGNCRMCLVEVEKSPKPVASCAYPVMANMKIKTDTPVVKKAREGVMEFLLANHPLDCPICDQGGECDLQDQSMYFGSDRSRFREVKRTIEDKNLGPLVKTVMSRCVHCTRCIRFTSEICGITALGMTGRGNQTEVGTYIDRVLDSELSGNVIDLCPVGALTSKPYSFSTRPWELVKTESVDTLDAVGSAIRIDSRGPEVMRILPRLNEDVNEEWLGDKARFAYDGLKRQRLDAPLMKQGEQFVPISWSAALVTMRDKLQGLKGDDLLGVVGEQADAEAMVALKDWMEQLGSHAVITTQHPLPFGRQRSSYLFNSTISGIEEADAVLLLNCNPRMEAAVISARIRKSVRQFGQQVMSIGPRMDLNMPHTHIGDSMHSLHSFVRGSKAQGKAKEERGEHEEKTARGRLDAAAGREGAGASEAADEEMEAARDAFTRAKRPMVIVGMGAFKDESTGKAVMAALEELKTAVPALSGPSWSGVNILHTNASAVGALDLGIGNSGAQVAPHKAKFVYLLGADHVEELSARMFAPDAFVVYAGSHGDVGASLADLVLPSPAYTEKTGTYVNIEGRVQRTKAAVGRLAEAREDWQIIRAASELTQTPLPYHSLEQIRERLVELRPSFEQLESLASSAQQHTQEHAASEHDHDRRVSAVDAKEAAASPPSSTASSSSSSSRFVGVYSNYFFTDPISRSSATMAKCSATLPQSRNSYTEHSQQTQQTAQESKPSKPAVIAAREPANPSQPQAFT